MEKLEKTGVWWGALNKILQARTENFIIGCGHSVLLPLTSLSRGRLRLILESFETNPAIAPRGSPAHGGAGVYLIVEMWIIPPELDTGCSR